MTWPSAASPPTGATASMCRRRGTEDSVTYGWLRDMVDLLERGDSAEEVLEHSKLAMYQDQVFCFTPKGSLISLPRGATPIDFAYAVHTDLGNSAVGAKVNGNHVAAAHPAQEWRPGGNHHHQGFLAVAHVGAVRGHGPGARRNPPLPAPCPARRACALRAQDPGQGLCRRGPRADRQGHRAKWPRNCAWPRPRMSMPMSGRGALRGAEVLQAVFPELKRAGKVAKKPLPGALKPISIRGLTEGISYNLAPVLPSAAGRPHRGHQCAGRGAGHPHHRLRRTGQGA